MHRELAGSSRFALALQATIIIIVGGFSAIRNGSLFEPINFTSSS